MSTTGTKRKHVSDGSSNEESSDESWAPSEGSQGTESPAPPARIQTRSCGKVERPTDQAAAAMEIADAVVDGESDLSSDTEEDDEEEEESCEEEEEEEESDEEDYSDDDSFVTSNEDPDREEPEEVVKSYKKVFDDEDYDDATDGDDEFLIDDGLPVQVPEIDYSVGGYVAGTGGDM
jgi:hypothetical protein